jgi:hypothetical protein
MEYQPNEMLCQKDIFETTKDNFAISIASIQNLFDAISKL